MADLSPLRRRMIEDMIVRNLSPATQRSYISAVSKFSRYFGRSPDRVELEDVRAFQVHLVSTGISWPALNQIVCALSFFLRPHARRGAHSGAHSLCARTPQAAGGTERRRSRAVPRGRVEPEEPRRAHHRLCGWAQGLRGRGTADRRHRQCPRRHPGAPRQGREGSQRDAVAPAAGHPAHLLAARPAAALSIPWS